jgi:hypothetical protein
MINLGDCGVSRKEVSNLAQKDFEARISKRNPPFAAAPGLQTYARISAG